MTAFAEQWGRPLEKAGYTQLSNLLLRRWREIGLSRTERDNIQILISYQDDPNERAVPSARQLAYDSGCGYDTTRKNLKRLCAPVLDEAGQVVRKQLLYPVKMKNGRMRYAMTALKHALEKLDNAPALAIVKPPKVRPAPKPEPIMLYEEKGALAEMTSREVEDEDAIADWEEVKERLRSEPDISPAAYDNWIAPTRGDHWNDRTLVVAVFSSGHVDVLERWHTLIKQTCQRMFGNISIAFKVVLAATVGV